MNAALPLCHSGHLRMTMRPNKDGHESHADQRFFFVLFLKKRTKTLLFVWAEPIRRGRSQTDKSFLLLFFKKEVLSAAVSASASAQRPAFRLTATRL
jgi:hypothetical protein